jgi:peroxiredoxin
MRRLVALALIIALPVLTVVAGDDEALGSKGGKDAPAFALKDTNGKAHTLEQYKDKIVVLEWTEPGCPYIVNHAKAGTMKKIAKDYADKGVVFLGICTSRNTDTDGMKSFMKEQKIDYTVLMDPTGEIGRAYGASNTPHMFVIQGGKIVYEGAIDDDPRMSKKDGAVNYVRQALDELIAKKAVTTAKTKPYG